MGLNPTYNWRQRCAKVRVSQQPGKDVPGSLAHSSSSDEEGTREATPGDHGRVRFLEQKRDLDGADSPAKDELELGVLRGEADVFVRRREGELGGDIPAGFQRTRHRGSSRRRRRRVRVKLGLL